MAKNKVMLFQKQVTIRPVYVEELRNSTEEQCVAGSMLPKNETSLIHKQNVHIGVMKSLRFLHSQLLSNN